MQVVLTLLTMPPLVLIRTTLTRWILFLGPSCFMLVPWSHPRERTPLVSGAIIAPSLLSPRFLSQVTSEMTWLWFYSMKANTQSIWVCSDRSLIVLLLRFRILKNPPSDVFVVVQKVSDLTTTHYRVEVAVKTGIVLLLYSLCRLICTGTYPARHALSSSLWEVQLTSTLDSDQRFDSWFLFLLISSHELWNWRHLLFAWLLETETDGPYRCSRLYY